MRKNGMKRWAVLSANSRCACWTGRFLGRRLSFLWGWSLGCSKKGLSWRSRN